MHKYAPASVANRRGRTVYQGGAMARAACPHCGNKIPIYVPPTSGQLSVTAFRRLGSLEWTRTKADGTFVESRSGESPFVELHIHPTRRANE